MTRRHIRRVDPARVARLQHIPIRALSRAPDAAAFEALIIRACIGPEQVEAMAALRRIVEDRRAACAPA